MIASHEIQSYSLPTSDLFVMFANCSTHASIMIVILFLFRFIAKYEKRLIRIEDGSIEYQMIENHLVFASLYQSLQSERSTGNITCMLHKPYIESCICFVKKNCWFHFCRLSYIHEHRNILVICGCHMGDLLNTTHVKCFFRTNEMKHYN